jgi:hypothetical protein
VKRLTVKKLRSACKMTKRERDKHDRAYVLSFMRQCISILAREDVDVNQKVSDVAAIARRLAPAIMAERRSLRLLGDEGQKEGL